MIESVTSDRQRHVMVTGSHSQLVERPLPADDPRQRQPDIGLARRELGWEPAVALDEGLRRTIDYFDALLSAGGDGRALNGPASEPVPLRA